MEWIEALSGTIVGLDTAPLIYFIEEHPTYLPLVRLFFEAVDRGDFRVVTSVLTLTEVLVHPLRLGDRLLAGQYRRILLHAAQITTLPVSETIADEAAQLRGAHGLRTPDAIQLATAIHAGASCFLTNDSRLSSAGTSLKVLILNQLSAPTP
jgi:predicted nucleic acid-binding protein